MSSYQLLQMTSTINVSPVAIEGSKKFSIEKLLKSVETAWGIKEEELRSWNIVSPFIAETPEPQASIAQVDIVDISVETKEACCNTEDIDFELHKRENLPSGYKLMYAVNRNINVNSSTKTKYNIPQKLKMDKGCSAIDVEFQSANSTVHMEQLGNRFPLIPKKYLLEIYQKCEGDFNWTVDVLLTADNTLLTSNENDNDDDEAMMAYINYVTNTEPDESKEEHCSNSSYKSSPITQEIVDEIKHDMETSSNVNAVSKLTGDDYRSEAMMYHLNRKELRRKAQQYNQRGMTEVAQFYSDLATKQTANLERANSWAVTSYLDEHTNRLQKSYQLDLHYLYTKEAIAAVDVFIDKHINLLRESREEKKHQELYIITGRGKHSEDGKSKLKPVVIGRLEERNIRYVHLNDGLLKIKVTRQTLMANDVP